MSCHEAASTSTRRRPGAAARIRCSSSSPALEAIGTPAVLVAHEAGELKRRAQEGLRFIGFRPRSEFDVHAAWQLGKVLRDVQPDVVHAHDPMAVALTAMALQMTNGLGRSARSSSRRAASTSTSSGTRSRSGSTGTSTCSSPPRGVIAGILAGDGIPPRSHRDRPRRRERRLHRKAGSGRRPRGVLAAAQRAARRQRRGARGRTRARATWSRPPRASCATSPTRGSSSSARASCAIRSSARSRTLGARTARHSSAGFRSDALGLMKSFDLFVMSSVTEGLGSVDARSHGVPPRDGRARAPAAFPKSSSTARPACWCRRTTRRALADAIVALLGDDALQGATRRSRPRARRRRVQRRADGRAHARRLPPPCRRARPRPARVTHAGERTLRSCPCLVRNRTRPSC